MFNVMFKLILCRIMISIQSASEKIYVLYIFVIVMWLEWAMQMVFDKILLNFLTLA